MIAPPAGVRIWLVAGATDMRRGFHGLAALVAQHLNQDPFSGQIFAFRGRRGHLIELLFCDGQGQVLYAKRLEHGHFIWPSISEGTVSMTPAQLAMLTEGIDWVRRETGEREEVKVHYGEGVANHTDPESCAYSREVGREALTGARAGQPLSDERLRNRSADVIQSTEGNTVWRAIASARRAPRHRRPWHVCTSLEREPRGLRHTLGRRPRGRIGKARCRSR